MTGGSRGIGRAIVARLAGQGAKVAVVATSEQSAGLGVEAAQAAGGEACAYAADVRDSARAKEVVGQVVEAWGGVNILVNNAGVTRDQLLMRMSDEDIDTVIDTNLKAALSWTRAVAKPMMKARNGSVINISSIVGLVGSPGQSNYAAAKAGLFGVTRSLAAELGARGVRVNAIAPGFIQTDMTKELGEDLVKASLEKIPLNRLGDPDDIARGVAFLASDEAAYVTGTTLVIDGGMSL
ncbi:MAG: beta-ketoacyl-ACP reductase [Planctomycetota bacterium]|nr:MAG: beta-ketoacyl-ACP reductase [Planctomycetota bacterium]